MDSITNFWQQHQQRLATLTSMLLVVLMMMTIVNTTVFVLDNLDSMHLPEQKDIQKPAIKSSLSLNIGELNLFGRAEAISAPKTVDAPRTNLNLELLGVFDSDQPDDSAAVVSQKNKEGELYHIGDQLPGNATLDSVHDDHILIKRGSRLEKLVFSEQVISTEAPRTNIIRNALPRASRSSNSSSRLSQIRSHINEREEMTASPGLTNSTGTALREYVETHRDSITTDPIGMLANIGVSPVESGRLKGYKLQSSNTVLTKAGLRQGDVILSVNGKAVGDAAKDSALIERALADKRVRVEVRRDTRRFFLTVPIP
ncbi:MAG: hypothetical protein CMQ33_06600 [Gammaproteobacteria bacterium]|nr:hypothetical protein [Gammaproteobacteria bacterium]